MRSFSRPTWCRVLRRMVAEPDGLRELAQAVLFIVVGLGLLVHCLAG